MEIRRPSNNHKTKGNYSSSTANSPKNSKQLSSFDIDALDYPTNNEKESYGIYSKPKDIPPFKKYHSVINLNANDDLDIELEGESKIIPILLENDQLDLNMLKDTNFNTTFNPYHEKPKKMIRNKSCDNGRYKPVITQEAAKERIHDKEKERNKPRERDYNDPTLQEMKIVLNGAEKENLLLKRENQKLKTQITEMKTKVNKKELSDRSMNSNSKLIQENQEMKLLIKQLQFQLQDKEKSLNNKKFKRNNLRLVTEIKGMVIKGSQGQSNTRMKNIKLENDLLKLRAEYDELEKEKENLELKLSKATDNNPNDEIIIEYKKRNEELEIQLEEYIQIIEQKNEYITALNEKHAKLEQSIKESSMTTTIKKNGYPPIVIDKRCEYNTTRQQKNMLNINNQSAYSYNTAINTKNDSMISLEQNNDNLIGLQKQKMSAFDKFRRMESQDEEEPIDLWSDKITNNNNEDDEEQVEENKEDTKTKLSNKNSQNKFQNEETETQTQASNWKNLTKESNVKYADFFNEGDNYYLQSEIDGNNHINTNANTNNTNINTNTNTNGNNATNTNGNNTTNPNTNTNIKPIKPKEKKSPIMQLFDDDMYKVYLNVQPGIKATQTFKPTTSITPKSVTRTKSVISNHSPKPKYQPKTQSIKR